MSEKKTDNTGSLFRGQKDSPSSPHWKRNLIRGLYPYILLLTDILVISIIFMVALSLKYEVSLTQALSRKVFFVISFSSIFGIYLIGGYNYLTNKNSLRFISEHAIVSSCVLVAVFFIIYSFLAYGIQLKSGRSVVASTLIVFPILSMGYRTLSSRIRQSLQKGNALCIIGADSSAKDLYQRLKKNKFSHTVFVFDSDKKKIGKNLIEKDPSSPIIGPLKQFVPGASIAGKYIENYIITLPMERISKKLARNLAITQFNGINVSTLEVFLREKLMIIGESSLSMGWIFKEGFLLNKNLSYIRLKRMSDIFLALFCLLVSSPILALATLMIKLTSQGPVFFSQVRVGKKELPFTLYKLRTMHVGSEQGNPYTTQDDARITLVGKFLRKTRIDELPQFWNVLKGDISVIGPRAEWIVLVKKYEKKFPFYHFRHVVKPGITGWAQVNYPYGETDEDTLEKLNYDLYYVRNYSLLLDASIIIKTIYTIIFGKGR